MGALFEQALKPPNIIVLLCLLFFVCTTIIMAVFIQNVQEFPNSEISRTWAKFLTGMSGVELCATAKESWPEEIAKNFYDVAADQAAGSSITVLAQMKLIRELTRLPSAPIAVSGRLALGDWAHLCYATHGKETYVNISFVIPENASQAESSEVCVILSGTKTFLPLSRPTAVCVPPVITVNNTRLGMLTGRADEFSIFNTMKRNKDPCNNGSLVKVAYNTASDNVMILSEKERMRISRNLELTGIFVLLLCVAYVTVKLIVARYSMRLINEGYATPQMT